MKPGEYFLTDELIELNPGTRKLSLDVTNTGDRAVQVGSHYHFFEVNKALDFDRNAAMGMRLNILAGNTLRFEPGDTRTVELVEFTGNRRAVGFNNLVDGSVTDPENVGASLERARQQGYKGVRPETDGRD
jgi:urease beta subunit